MTRTFIQLERHGSEAPVYIDAAWIISVSTDAWGSEIATRIVMAMGAYCDVVESPEQVLAAIGLNEDINIAVKPADECPAPGASGKSIFDYLLDDVEDLEQNMVERASDLRARIAAAQEKA